MPNLFKTARQCTGNADLYALDTNMIISCFFQKKMKHVIMVLVMICPKSSSGTSLGVSLSFGNFKTFDWAHYRSLLSLE